MPRLTTRDYKRPSRSSSAAKLKQFGLGVLVGAVLASTAFMIAGAHARHRAATASGTHSGAGGEAQGVEPHAPAADDTSSNSVGSDAGTQGGASGAASATASAHGASPAPHYDFYRMLPSFKVPVPHDDDHRSHAPPPAAQAGRAAGSGASYLLQVGSYRSGAEADQVRARLARAGIAAQVQRVAAGSGTWNRVRIGPLTDAQLAKVREQLRTANIHALLIRADR
ncbi:MAG TPA: SPOR domain-containing protein [Steroidobacteraceae bacterium]|jgi:cell division protein FtsN|nr:SPOR domain-containing protein [Steroidobacteraceae bacterium]